MSVTAASLSYIASRAPEYAQVLDRLQYRERIESTRAAVEELRTKGLVPALIGLGRRFAVANRALLGR